MLKTGKFMRSLIFSPRLRAPIFAGCRVVAKAYFVQVEICSYSTDDSYPLCHGNTTFCQFAENEAEQFTEEVYIYYIPAETAHRWAVSRGMDADTCEKVFGPSAA